MKILPPRSFADTVALERLAMELRDQCITVADDLGWCDSTEFDRNVWRDRAMELLNEAGAHWRPEE